DLLHFLPDKLATYYNRAERKARSAARAIFNFGGTPIHRSPSKDDVTVSAECMRILREAVSPIQKHLDAKTAFANLTAAAEPLSLHELPVSMFTLPGWQKRKVIEQLQSQTDREERFVAQMKSELQDEYAMGITGLPPNLRASCQYIRRYFVQSVRYL